MMWIVPTGTKVSDNQITEQIGDWFGGRVSYWRYSSPDMEYNVYYNPIRQLPFPISNKGLCINVDQLFFHDSKVEDIYMVCDNIVTHYDAMSLHEAGWNDHGDGHYTFNIPPNKSDKERYWRVRMFYRNSQTYIDRINHREVIIEGDTTTYILKVPDYRWPCTELSFIQPVDSTFLLSIYNNSFASYEKLIPQGYKPWGRD